jgi:Sulfatase
LRTGLLKVGLPAAKEGLPEKDPTIAELLKPQGYVTGQFGKNHLGDRNEFLPTVPGFDEFFGNLYHLNAEEESENPDYPKNPSFKAQYGPRGVMKCVAVPTDTPGDDPRFGAGGKQKCEEPDRSPRSAWRRSTRSSLLLQRISSIAQIASSCGSIRAACIDSLETRIPGQNRSRYLSRRHGRT